MNWTKNLHLLLIGFLCGAMLMSFQNCGESLDLEKIQQASNAHPNAPRIQSSTTELSVVENQSLDLEVLASGENLFYEWQKDGLDIGINGSTFNIASVALSDAGVYTVEVSNDFGYVLYDIVVSVSQAPVPAAPTIATAVNNINVSFVNGTFFVIPFNQATPALATFTVSVQGDQVGYQWYKVTNNVETPIAGATTATHSFNVTSLSHAGTYRVRASNGGGAVMSEGVMNINIIDIGNINL